MAFDVDLGPDPSDLATLIDEEGRAFDPEMFAAVQVLLFPDAVRVRDLALVVAQQREVEMVLVAELSMARGVIPADAEDDRSLRRHAGEIVSEAARFLRAPRRVVLRIEIQDYLLPSKVLQGHPPSVVGSQREVGGRFANRGHQSPRVMQASVRHNVTDSARDLCRSGRCRPSCNIVSGLVFLVASFM